MSSDKVIDSSNQPVAQKKGHCENHWKGHSGSMFRVPDKQRTDKGYEVQLGWSQYHAVC